MLYDTPPCGTPASSVSGDESMHNHIENATPPGSPSKPDSPGAATADRIGRLSLDNDHPIQHLDSRKDIVTSSPTPASASKRAASSDLPRQKRPTLITQSPRATAPSKRGRLHSAKRTFPRRHPAEQQHYGQNFHRSSKEVGSREPHVKDQYQPIPRDSGYESTPSRAGTFQSLHSNHAVATLDLQQGQPLSTLEEQPQGEANPIQPPNRDRYPGLILQPESSPISKDQLAAEVKGIYAGLVMVEAKCINVDAAQANDPNSQLGPEQWQALIALHRTLLYEHHDFLMATQHPSATGALRGLASKYSMPARMWRHGIHAFLEILRHRRPESQDYMMAFIYLAYQMMALLFETVPTFLDTWIECLGDLARYRMAIEEEREAHATWGAVAGRWYRLAADRHPATGRLNHHLGILERPSLRKLFLYAKSLTCVIPFVNARDSLATLCGPIVQDEQTMQRSTQSVEARIVTLYALFFSAYDEDTIGETAKDTLIRLGSQPGSKIRDIGVELVVTGVAFVLELGSTSNAIWQLFANAINEVIQTSRPSTLATAGSPAPASVSQNQSSIATTFPNSLAYDFCYKTFNLLLRHRKDRQSLRDVLASVHTVLVWIHGVYTIRSRSNKDLESYTFSSLISPDVFCWGELSDYLNKLSQAEPINARTIEFARQGMFLTPERADEARPLSEDFLIRGLIWTQFYYPSDWFSGPIDDEGRAIETAGMHKARVERVQWLGLYLAFRIEHLKFDINTRSFSASVSTPPVLTKPIDTEMTSVRHELSPNQSTPPPSRSSTTVSANSDSDGYAVVTSSRKKPIKTRAKVSPSSTKMRPDHSLVKVVDKESIQWEQEI